MNIVRKYEDKIDYWLSEKDLGIYDAFNKGLELCSGDLIGFVNSDDYLMPNALEILVKFAARTDGEIILILFILFIGGYK